MHIHINKDIFTTFHLFKFYNFYYKNSKLLSYISGRTWDGMKRWAATDKDDLVDIKYFAKSKSCRNRHSAINLKNPETVEN